MLGLLQSYSQGGVGSASRGEAAAGCCILARLQDYVYRGPRYGSRDPGRFCTNEPVGASTEAVCAGVWVPSFQQRSVAGRKRRPTWGTMKFLTPPSSCCCADCYLFQVKERGATSWSSRFSIRSIRTHRPAGAPPPMCRAIVCLFPSPYLHPE